METFCQLAERHPGSARALLLLGKYLDTQVASKHLAQVQLDPAKIQQICEVSSSKDFVTLVSILIAEQVLRRVILVQTPTCDAVAEFSSFDAVPDYIADPRGNDAQIRVTPHHLRTVYMAKVC